MKRYSVTLVFVIGISTLFVGCKRTSSDVWNDTKSAGRHISRGVNTLGGKHGDSRQINSAEEFAQGDMPRNEYLGFDDDSIKVTDDIAQAKETPGDVGSSVPGIDAFIDPASNPAYASIFKNVHFDYNSSLIKTEDDLFVVQKIAEYLKSHPNMYLFVEGHCDKRGPQAYNFALGANRANSVRSLLVKEGVNADHIFTVSYGKERPLAEGDGEEFFRVNRRGQFKVYEK
jgi:peptidoglycan-associated lipoprotein